jgi:hypothetical protein
MRIRILPTSLAPVRPGGASSVASASRSGVFGSSSSSSLSWKPVGSIIRIGLL